MYSRLSPEMHGQLSANSYLVFLHVKELESALYRLHSALSRVRMIWNTEVSKSPQLEYDRNSLLFIALKEVAEAFSVVSRVFFPLNPRRMKHIREPETIEEFNQRKGVAETRGRLLREFFEIDDDNPIGNTLLRNRIVHMDEDIDLIHIRRDGRPIIRTITAPVNKKVEGIPDDAVIERFDPDTSSYYVLGQALHLNEVAQIAQKLNSEIKTVEQCIVGAFPNKEAKGTDDQ